MGEATDGGCIWKIRGRYSLSMINTDIYHHSGNHKKIYIDRPVGVSPLNCIMYGTVNYTELCKVLRIFYKNRSAGRPSKESKCEDSKKYKKKK